MTKEKLVEFTCDECKHKIIIEESKGFPYENGWCYIYKFCVKALNYYAVGIETSIKKIELKDKHFCSEEHMFDFISNNLKVEIKEEK
jgi:hypothetical protein